MYIYVDIMYINTCTYVHIYIYICICGCRNMYTRIAKRGGVYCPPETPQH